jgi:glutaredoxin
MQRICPKCHYARQSTDVAPEWQCPSCQVAYNKVADSKPVSALQAKRPQSQPRETSNVRRIQYLALAVILGMVALQSYSSWKRQHTRKQAVVSSEANASGQPAVILYGTSWCGYCAAARAFFQQHGIAYQDVDVEQSREAAETFKKLGGGGIPMITVGDEVLRGYNEAALRQWLNPWMDKR